ncbi:alpha/beta hydrolase [Ilumatobacter sp.]|uniref:alpha/beta hydrolase n=1 Tax=Ilumatobacter sp. TaxID=1967498 RepID=UPI003B526B8E
MSPRRLIALLVPPLLVSCTGSGDPEAVRSDVVRDTAEAGTVAGGATGGSAPPDTSATGASDPPSAEGSTPAGSGGAGEGSLDWAPCEEQGPLVELECATLRVPFDHDDPDGEQIDIAVARVDSADDDSRIGSLVFNPGGPGGSGIEFLQQVTAVVSADVAAAFDLVSFDPRGVGSSTSLDCDVDLDDEITLLPDGDDDAWDRLLTESEQQLASCTAETLELAEVVGTNAAARDLELLRAALGDDGLSYVGYSYGTRLGAAYAELFPGAVRAMVLDGAVKPTDDFSELSAGQAEGFDRALENFAAACDGDADCVLSELGPTLEVLDSVRSEIAAEGSFATDDPDRVLTPGELDLGVLSALYSKQAWPFLAQALLLAETGADGSLFQVLVDNYVGRRLDGTYDNSQVANGFINCADDAERPAPDEVRAESDAAADTSEWFGDLLRASTGCLGLPAPDDPIVVGPATGAPPILVVGSTGDPATPYEWSEELAQVLDSGVLYTVEAEGHTAYGSIECVGEVVDAYLLDLEVPAEGASCSDNVTADFFVPSGESEIDLVVELFACLRENGLDIPEVSLADVLADPAGEELGEYLDPTDPAFAEAVAGCTELLGRLQEP